MAAATDKELQNKQVRCRVMLVCYSYMSWCRLDGYVCDQLDVYVQMVRILSCVCTEGESLRLSLNLSCIEMCGSFVWCMYMGRTIVVCCSFIWWMR
jgi:hypothetical protein